jgi:hypothetical protein
MRARIPVFFLVAACGGLEASPTLPEDTKFATPEPARPCRPPSPTPIPTDAGLPAWAVGDFHDDAAELGDSVNLRIGPGLTFEYSVSGCDVFGGATGIVVESSSEAIVLAASDGGTFNWSSVQFGSDGFAQVTRATLHPADGGGLLSVAGDGGPVHWAPALRCGCGSGVACTCEDPLVNAKEP